MWKIRTAAEPENTRSFADFCESMKEGQKACFEIPVSKNVFTVVGEDGVREEKGTHFVFYVGCSQPDARSLELTGKASLEIHYERR